MEASIPIAYTLFVTGPVGFEIFEYYDKHDVMLHFLNRSLDIVQKLVDKVSKTNTVTESQVDKYNKAKVCDMCWQPLRSTRTPPFTYK